MNCTRLTELVDTTFLKGVLDTDDNRYCSRHYDKCTDYFI